MLLFVQQELQTGLSLANETDAAATATLWWTRSLELRKRRHLQI